MAEDSGEYDIQKWHGEQVRAGKSEDADVSSILAQNVLSMQERISYLVADNVVHESAGREQFKRAEKAEAQVAALRIALETINGWYSNWGTGEMNFPGEVLEAALSGEGVVLYKNLLEAAFDYVKYAPGDPVPYMRLLNSVAALSANPPPGRENI